MVQPICQFHQINKSQNIITFQTTATHLQSKSIFRKVIRTKCLKSTFSDFRLFPQTTPPTLGKISPDSNFPRSTQNRSEMGIHSGGNRQKINCFTGSNVSLWVDLLEGIRLISSFLETFSINEGQ